MSIVNAVFRSVIDVVLLPFRGLPTFVAVAFFALLLAVGMLLVYKATSNQAKIAAAKDRIQAGIFEIRLFNDDLRAIFRAQGEILRANFGYMGLALVPLAWVIVPMVLSFAQLHHHWGYRGLAVGEPVPLTVVLAPDWETTHPDLRDATTGRPRVSLEAPDGLRVDTPAVWLPSRNEVAWRVVPEAAEDWTVAIRVGDETFAKTVSASTRPVLRSPRRHDGGFLAQLLEPAEPALPKGGAVEEIAVPYAGASVWFFGAHLEWVWPLLILSVVFGFALKDPLKVEI